MTTKAAPLVLGIDPGFASLGYALVTPHGEAVRLGVVRTTKSTAKAKTLASEDNVRRTRELARELSALLEGVGLVCAESMSFPRNAAAAAKMAMAWGVIVALANAKDIAIIQASPQTVKLRVCGDKSASKMDVEAAMMARYGAGLKRMLKGVPAGVHEHAFDALAVARGCLDSDEVRMLRQAWK